jgi:hypothetical protein
MTILQSGITLDQTSKTESYRDPDTVSLRFAPGRSAEKGEVTPHETAMPMRRLCYSKIVPVMRCSNPIKTREGTQ